MNCDKLKRLSYLIFIIYIFSLIPVIILSFYNYPSADDYSFAREAHRALNQGEGLFGVFEEVIERVARLYNTWQGNYTGVFMMSFTPLIIGEKGYFLGTVLACLMLSYGSVIFLKAVYENILKLSGKNIYAIAGIVLFIIIQCMPNEARVEGLFWYNSVIYYTFSMGVLFCYVAVLIKILYASEKHLILNIAIASFLGIFLGGTNYVTGIVAAISSVVMIIFVIATVKGGLAKVIPPIIMLIAFVISIIAPGNSVREENLNGLGAVKSILVSYVDVLDIALSDWCSWIVIVLFMISSVLWYYIYKLSDFKTEIKYPILITFFCISISASSITPSLYATGDISGGRIQAGFWIMFIMMMEIVIAVWTAVFYKAFRSVNDKVIDKFAIMLIVAFICGAALNVGVNRNTFVFSEAAAEILDGSAFEYALENAARIKVLKGTEADVVVESLSVRPELLFYSDMSTDASDWTNTAVADYYGKNSVVVK